MSDTTNQTEDERAPDPVTILPLASSWDEASTLRVIDDRDQQVDHSHRPIPPVAPGSMPYRYKVRLRRRNAYASTADEVLAMFIDGYRARPGPGPEVELEQVRRRGEHCIGVIVTHVAQAVLDGSLTPAQIEVLQRSADYGTGRDPITSTECPRWDDPEVAMWLMGDLYAPEYGRFDPPVGKVRLIWPGRAERYLHDLADLGLIVLAEHPATTTAPMVEVRGSTS